MRSSLIILLFFSAGLLSGYAGILPVIQAPGSLSMYALYLLMFLVGISIGADTASLQTLRGKWKSLMLIPLLTISGTLLAVAAISMLMPSLSIIEALAVGSGFGYYSLSSVIISEMHSEALGVVALLSNVMREVITLVFSPLLAWMFGKLAPVVAAGATSMDTTLPIIVKVSGKEFAMVALFHGIVLTMLVPLLVGTLLTIF